MTDTTWTFLAGAGAAYLSMIPAAVTATGFGLWLQRRLWNAEATGDELRDGAASATVAASVLGQRLEAAEGEAAKPRAVLGFGGRSNTVAVEEDGEGCDCDECQPRGCGFLRRR